MVAGSKAAGKHSMAAAPHARSDALVVKRDTAAELENEAVVERTLNKLFSTGRDDVGFDELWRALHESQNMLPRAAIEVALESMEAADKVMYREGCVHLI